MLTRPAKGKGRAKVDPEFEREKAWLSRQDEKEEAVVTEEEVPEGEGIECGCCFSEYPFVCIHSLVDAFSDFLLVKFPD